MNQVIVLEHPTLLQLAPISSLSLTYIHPMTMQLKQLIQRNNKTLLWPLWLTCCGFFFFPRGKKAGILWLQFSLNLWTLVESSWTSMYYVVLCSVEFFLFILLVHCKMFQSDILHRVVDYMVWCKKCDTDHFIRFSPFWENIIAFVLPKTFLGNYKHRAVYAYAFSVLLFMQNEAKHEIWFLMLFSLM